MSFWEDASPAVKGILVFGVIAILYLVVARVAEMAPFSCPNEGDSCSGLLCSECEGGEASQQRGFNPETATSE